MSSRLSVISLAGLAAAARAAPADVAETETLMVAKAKTFSFAARFLPADRRRPVVVLYAFCRTLDDLVDEPIPGSDRAAVRAELDAWRGWLSADGQGPAPREPLGSQLAAVRADYQIPADPFLALIDGLKTDLEPCEMVDFAELRRYCYQVASTVGLAMAHVLGARSPQALAAAEALGIAMQLTNILRDIGDDLSQDRCYIPRDELAAFALSWRALGDLQRVGAPDDRFRSLMRFQIERARSYYRYGARGVWLLPPGCRLPILVASRLYARILTVIERNDYDVLWRRAATTRNDKLREAATALALLWWHGRCAGLAHHRTVSPIEGEGIDVAVRSQTSG